VVDDVGARGGRKAPKTKKVFAETGEKNQAALLVTKGKSAEDTF
jgi:hypothetical protein